jgi:GAF domain-containing protein
VSDRREASRQAALEALVAVARRLGASSRLTTPVDDALLTAVARTAATVLDAQAASIAVHDPTRGRLVFVAAAGPAAGEVVGLDIDDSVGIAGYAFSTGQPLAVADVSADPRFDRTVAEVTGYVPGSILATPLTDDDGTIGVLEALDRRTGTFSLRDLDVAAAIAGEAVAVVRAGRARHDAAGLLRGALRAVLAAESEGDPLDDEAIDALVEDVVASLPGDPDDPTLRLADRIARLREVDPDSVELAIEWLDVLLRRGGRGRRSMGRSPRP